MGYRVGLQCFHSKETAHDFVLSSVAPVIMPDGSLVRPEKVGSEWQYRGVEVKLSFPECSNMKQFQDGMNLGAAFMAVFIVMVGFRAVYKMIYQVGQKNDS